MISRWMLPSVLALAILLAGCRDHSDTRSPQTESPAVSQSSIEDVMNRHVDQLMAIDGVTMVYIGQTDDERPCIKIGILSQDAEFEARLPTELEGYPVVVEVTGEIRPLQ